MASSSSRIFPTASSRRRRTRDESNVAGEPKSDSLQSTVTSRRHRPMKADILSPMEEESTVLTTETLEDDGEEKNEPFLGGPDDPSVLRSFKNHIAAAIWTQQERPLLKCLQHASKLAQWKWEPNNNYRFNKIVIDSGLSQLVTFSFKFIDKTLVSAFVERWQPETNTFHLPFGEMTITLHDVSKILGIPIVGRPLSTPKLTNESAKTLLVEALGVTIEEASDELSKVRGQYIRLEWLRLRFSNVSDMCSHSTIQNAARAYLLYLLGCTLFTDKSNGRVQVAYLKLLMDLDSIKEYAWGTGALTFLYQQLGHATRSSARQIAGYLTLLQAWVYEHIPFTSPRQNFSYEDTQPRVLRWVVSSQLGSSNSDLQMMRETLDTLTAARVVWNPYVQDFHEITFYSGCIKCLDILETYNPERVLRQFELVQTIPPDPFVKLGQSRKKDYAIWDQHWSRWENHVLSASTRGKRVSRPAECSADYLQWFCRISHISVQHPDHRSSHEQHLGSTSHIDYDTRIDQAWSIIDSCVQLGRDQPNILYERILQLRDLFSDIRRVRREDNDNV